MFLRVLAIALLAFAVLLFGCGGGNGSNDSTAAVTVPSIVMPPASLSVAVGASASFSVAARGTATLIYQWRKAGAVIAGASASTFKIDSVTESDAGSYDVAVSNSSGSVTSSIATLTVTNAAGAVAPTISV